MTKFTALFDACVLYPAPLRDLLMRVALTDLFRARWTDKIHGEWISNVLKNRPDLTYQQLERTRELMNAHVRDSLVTGYESLIEELNLPDPDDRHVLAAAIHTKASVIVTFNLKDFPPKYLSTFDIKAQHPDEFISYLLNLDSDSVCSAVRQQRASLNNPKVSVDDLLRTFEKQQLHQTAARLRDNVDKL